MSSQTFNMCLKETKDKKLSWLQEYYEGVGLKKKNGLKFWKKAFVHPVYCLGKKKSVREFLNT